MRSIAKKYDIKIIPTTDAHFIHPEHKVIQDVMLQSGGGHWHFHHSAHQIEADELFEGIKFHLPDLTEDEFALWIDNTYELIPKETFYLTQKFHLPTVDIPDYIKNLESDYNKQLLSVLEEKIKKHKRAIPTEEYQARLEKELNVICRNPRFNFLAYFLVYEDICEYARSIDVLLGLARGSAGGSLLAYYLRITNIDPIKEKLPFERFLSFARIAAGSTPDIDTDFSSRVKILNYLQDKYKTGFAQLCTLQTIKIKTAIKDTMWSLYKYNRNHPVVTSVTQDIPDSQQGTKEMDFVY